MSFLKLFLQQMKDKLTTDNIHESNKTRPRYSL